MPNTLPQPKWFEALKKDPKAAESGIHWFTPEEAEAKRAELAEAAARFVPVGEGPTALDRQGHKTRSLLLLARQSPDELKVALSPTYPPLLWIGAGQTAASFKEATAVYFPQFMPVEDKLERTVRGFLGTGAGGKLDLIQLHDRYKAAAAFIDPLAWGSQYTKDPFLDSMPRGPQGQDLARRYSEQAKEGLATFSFRSLFSKSVLRVEAHANVAPGVHLFIGQVRYHAAKQAAVIHELNQKLGMHLPEDLPVDVAGALIGLPFDPPEVIRAALPQQTDPAKLAFGLLCLESLDADAAALEKDLRQYASHPEGSVRQLVANLAHRRKLAPLLSEMAASEPHPELKKQLTAML